MASCVGAALAGQRPIVEMQFNDFVATGFNQLVNNAAKIRYRWGGSVPMVVRMPWGGLRHAGPYHSQNTEAVVLSDARVEDRRAVDAIRRASPDGGAVADPDPVLYYEHIALYRDPRIKQVARRGGAAADPDRHGGAAARRATISRSFRTARTCHVALRVAERLAADGRRGRGSRSAFAAAARSGRRFWRSHEHCSRVLIVHEDSRTGGIGESIAAIIQEEAFEFLDAPVRIIGALDTPVPYSPPLEDAFPAVRGRRSSAPPGGLLAY